MNEKTITGKLGSSPILAVGIDVSKASLSIAAITEQSPRVFSIRNDAESAGALGRALSACGFTGKLVLESTGYYHWCAALGLAQAGLDVRLVNPLLASKHAGSAIRKVKTDPVDAVGLGHLALTERKLPPRFDKGPDYVRLRHCMGLIQKLDKTLQSIKAALQDYHAACDCAGQASDSEALAGLHTTAKHLQKDKERLLAEFSAEVTHAYGADTPYPSVPGISNVTAAVMQLMLNPGAECAKAWVAYCGLDLSVRQSGTWKGRSRLTKRGNPYLRKRVFQAAWGAVMNDPDFKAYYDRLRADNRPHKETIIIVARKLLRIAFNLVKTGQTYDRNIAWA